MELTNNCQEAFNKWFILGYPRTINYLNLELGEDIMQAFYNLHFSMQYGVYVDFFDSVEMQIYVKPTSSIEGNWSVYIDNFGHHILTEYIYCDTRREARTQAIKKANEIYNKTHCIIKNIDTSDFKAGDELYLDKNKPGHLTNKKQ